MPYFVVGGVAALLCGAVVSPVPAGLVWGLSPSVGARGVSCVLWAGGGFLPVACWGCPLGLFVSRVVCCARWSSCGVRCSFVVASRPVLRRRPVGQLSVPPPVFSSRGFTWLSSPEEGQAAEASATKYGTHTPARMVYWGFEVPLRLLFPSP